MNEVILKRGDMAGEAGVGDGGKAARALYLELLKRTLSFMLWKEPAIPVETFLYKLPGPLRLLAKLGLGVFRLAGLQVHKAVNYTEQQRASGEIWPMYADTMIGLKRLDNLQRCVETVLEDGVPGDLIETGVWRGGACIYMRAILAAHGVTDRRVFVADSFEGLPEPDPEKYPHDKGDALYRQEFLAVSQEQVQSNFRRYGLLDGQVVFLKGWFKDTLPRAPIERLAVLRLDGDLYESTMDALEHLYPKLSPGGFCIIDDYCLPYCRAAVSDYRKQHGIADPIESIDEMAICWRRALTPQGRPGSSGSATS